MSNYRLVVVAAIASAFYFAVAGQFAVRIASSSVGDKTGLLSILLAPFVLYVVSAAVGYSERARPGAPIPVIGASLFGIFVCSMFPGI